jgi:23S rRNA (guanosine2251-2'-O)-methyltransferase
MADYIEGKRPVIEAFRTGVPMRRILMGDFMKRDPMVEDIMRKAKRNGVKVIQVPKKELDEKSARGSHQGVMAEAAPFSYVGIGEVVDVANAYAAEHDGRALVVICDHLTDAGNLGAISRSCEAVGACGMVIPNKRSARVEASTYKSSAGAISHMKVAQVSNLIQSIKRLQDEGFWVCGATEHTDDVIWQANLKGKIALVLGNEHDGVSRLVLEHCDFHAKLPLEGEVASLNVAQAATACMYEWLRQNTAAN